MVNVDDGKESENEAKPVSLGGRFDQRSNGTGPTGISGSNKYKYKYKYKYEYKHKYKYKYKYKHDE